MHRDLLPGDEYLIMASDGLWDVLSNKDVFEICKSYRPDCDPQQLADELVNNAMRKGSMDNVTCIVVRLTQYVKHTESINRQSLEKMKHDLDIVFRNRGMENVMIVSDSEHNDNSKLSSVSNNNYNKLNKVQTSANLWPDINSPKTNSEQPFNVITPMLLSPPPYQNMQSQSLKYDQFMSLFVQKNDGNNSEDLINKKNTNNYIIERPYSSNYSKQLKTQNSSYLQSDSSEDEYPSIDIFKHKKK